VVGPEETEAWETLLVELVQLVVLGARLLVERGEPWASSRVESEWPEVERLLLMEPGEGTLAWVVVGQGQRG
jgi:hypothetical protein